LFLFIKKQIYHESLPGLLEKTKQVGYVLPSLTKCHSTTSSYDLWMSKAGHDVFALVINFLGVDWQPKHITLGLSKPIDNSGQTLAKNLTKLMDSYALRRKIIAYVKD
jgi:hypothetical protein